MLALAAAGAEEGLWLRAQRQTAGRGRQGRAWVSPPGNLYASTLVRLQSGDPAAASLAFVAAVALWEAVHALLPHGLTPTLKWPNDLLLDGAKLAGILLERADDAVVVGIGANLAHHPEGLERPVTSLAAHGLSVRPDEFLEALAERLAVWLARWRSEGFAPIRAAWLSAAHPSGAALGAHLPDGTRTEGSFAGLDPDGALILRLAGGATRVIHAGDVFLI